MEKLVNWYCKGNDYKNPDVRERLGVLSSIIGIILNILLALVKFVIGFITGSIAIMSDSFNNLFDSTSNVIAFIGYKISNLPADKKHPYGHGRFEYLTSFVIGSIILFVGLSLAVTSIKTIINPKPIEFDVIIVVILFLSIFVKIWLALFNKKYGQKIDSMVMMSVYQDSFNDVIATTATIISYVLSKYINLPIDGIMGVIVSLFVMYSGFETIKDTVDSLLGSPIDHEVITETKKIIKASPICLGVHDLVFHTYGPTKIMASGHIEVSSKGNILDIHDEIDRIEKEVRDKLNIEITLHMDPVADDDGYVNWCRNIIKVILYDIDPSLKFHDFRAVKGPSHTNLIFDVVKPFECKLTNEELKEKIDYELINNKIQFYTVITFDIDYSED